MRLERAMAAAAVMAGLLIGSGIMAAEPEAQPETKPEAKPDGKSKHGPTQMGSALYNPWKPAAPKLEHQLLAGLVGKASTSMHVEAGPYPRAQDSQGTAEAKLLMGGLFVQVTQSGTRMKESFDRIILYGFDPVIGKYTADVVDSTSAAVVRYIGTYDDAKKQLNLTARYSDQNNRRYVTARLVTTFVDAKTWTYEEFLAPGQDKPEAQMSKVTLKKS